jgi:hypothetical protein
LIGVPVPRRIHQPEQAVGQAANLTATGVDREYPPMKEVIFLLAALLTIADIVRRWVRRER